MSDQDYENTIGQLDDRIAELEAEIKRLKKAIAIAGVNLPCSTEQCQLEVKAVLQAALEDKQE